MVGTSTVTKTMSQTRAKDQEYGPGEEWRATLDLDAFKRDVDKLGNELRAAQGPEDIAHLKKMITWQRVMLTVGVCTSWYMVNPISVFLISFAIMVRWTMIAHHVSHGGYDRHDNPDFQRTTFALGARRFMDWLDWMIPEAWNVEHNRTHHYQLGEIGDPDLVEENLKELREASWPVWLKYVYVTSFIVTWKWFYYAPNTLRELKVAEKRRARTPMDDIWHTTMTIASVNQFGMVGEVITRCVLPFALWQFVIMPLPIYLLLGKAAYTNTMITLFLAELLTNAHSFLVVVTNHCGRDLYRFDTPCTARSGEFYMRQVISSADFNTGSDIIDLFHGFLNYQIEHHMWPDLSMLQYQRSQPLVKKLCAKHGIPYVQENVFIRLVKTLKVMVGTESMKKW